MATVLQPAVSDSGPRAVGGRQVRGPGRRDIGAGRWSAKRPLTIDDPRIDDLLADPLMRSPILKSSILES